MVKSKMAAKMATIAGDVTVIKNCRKGESINHPLPPPPVVPRWGYDFVCKSQG